MEVVDKVIKRTCMTNTSCSQLTKKACREEKQPYDSRRGETPAEAGSSVIVSLDLKVSRFE